MICDNSQNCRLEGICFTLISMEQIHVVTLITDINHPVTANTLVVLILQNWIWRQLYLHSHIIEDREHFNVIGTAILLSREQINMMCTDKTEHKLHYAIFIC